MSASPPTSDILLREEADARVKRSLYSRAVGYSFNSEKIFCNKDGEVTRVPIVQHVPPDVTAQIFLEPRPSSLARRLAARARHRQVHHQRRADDRGGVDQGAHATVIDVTPERTN
jgi:hypothetical protein